mgnify:FL=1|tara:strand:- start:109 stop:456 length:348 start_codon:yes stop_codon:yes gene_type:complete
MFLNNIHERFKKQEIYLICKSGSYILVVIGFLTTLELVSYFFGVNIRPIGTITNFILTDIVSERNSNSLMPVAVEGSPLLNMVIMIGVVSVCFVSLLLFATYLSCIRKTLRAKKL